MAKSITVPGGGAKKKKAPTTPAAVAPVETPLAPAGALAQDSDATTDGLAAKLADAKVEDAEEEEDDDEEGGLC